MSLDHPNWKGRRKRPSRRINRDLRSILPFASVLFCFALSATAIMAIEWIPARIASPPPVSSAPVVHDQCDAEPRECEGPEAVALPSRQHGESAIDG